VNKRSETSMNVSLAKRRLLDSYLAQRIAR
jgi:hypothetical protein